MIHFKTRKWSKPVRFLALLGFLSVATFNVSACSKKSKPADVATAAPSIERIRASYRIALAQYGVHIVKVGQVVRVFVPTDTLFVSGSANLRPGQGILLATIARFIGTYKTIYVKVAAYTDDSLPAPIRLALSDKRAEVVGNRIWVNGIDSRIVTALGKGAHNSVDSNAYQTGQRRNRRVEITFKYFADRYQLL